MNIFQFTGLSGAGKTSIAEGVKKKFKKINKGVKIIDGDVYRKTLCKDLGFSKEDRIENIRRLGKEAFNSTADVIIISAINPYTEIREELRKKYNAKTIWICCSIQILKERDTKGLYANGTLPGDLLYFTPYDADLIIYTHEESLKESVQKVFNYINNIL